MFIAPRWALLSHTPRPEESLLKFIGIWLSTAREKSEKPNPWLRWPTAWGLLQATGGRTVPKGRVPTGGCYQQSAHPLPARVPVLLRMSLSQRARGTKPEAATLLSHRIWERLLWLWNSFLCLWHQQAYWAQNDMPGSRPKGHQVKKGSYLSCCPSLSTSQKMIGHKPITHRPHSQTKVEILSIL